ncbi:MAG: asparagine synthase (glutamine-hydrolyzing) [Candidatus Zixiibacteriota bacterium]
MCGFAGYVCFDGRVSGDPEGVARKMATAVAHRGPDDSGIWIDRAAGIGLAHRRLSIIDVSEAGHQPMLSRSERYVIAFNGEIYNHLALREELAREGWRDGSGKSAAPLWRGHSDTETLLAIIEAYGVAAALDRCVGMFAFALWDRQDGVVTLARDRLGEKPLYYGWVNGVLVFASELKALRQYPGFRAEVSRDTLALYLRHNYIPAPWSIYRDTWKLAPGSYVQFSTADSAPGNGDAGSAGNVRAYWSALAVARRGIEFPYQGSEGEAVAELERILMESVRSQMMADVPLGAFLSGGIDSSIVVALMQAQSGSPVKTFTIGFDEAGYDEAGYARAVARHFGTEHTELYVTPRNALDVIPKLPSIYDEPFADSSQLPTYLLAELTRKHVSVALSGDGGDEVFGGYNRYGMANSIWDRLRSVPRPLRRALAGAMRALPADDMNRCFRVVERMLPRRLRYANAGDKLHKLAEILAVGRAEDVYVKLVSHCDDPGQYVYDSVEPRTVLMNDAAWLPSDDFDLRMMYLDTVTYLPDDILVKVDRAAMAVGLETRVPLIDHRVVEFAWQLPAAMKVNPGGSKWILRKLLAKYLPMELFERPKMGFGVPIEHWLRGPLREWGEALLDNERLAREGYFNPDRVRALWNDHCSGKSNRAYMLWNVLMFQSWLECQRG